MLVRNFNFMKTVSRPSTSNLWTGLRFSSTSPQTVDNTEVAKAYSPTLLDSKQRLRLQIQDRVGQFQKHKSDCGSAAVQALVTTEKILNLTRHFLTHKKDKGSLRGFFLLISHRQSQLSYLKRTDVLAFQKVTAAIKELGGKAKAAGSLGNKSGGR